MEAKTVSAPLAAGRRKGISRRTNSLPLTEPGRQQARRTNSAPLAEPNSGRPQAISRRRIRALCWTVALLAFLLSVCLHRTASANARFLLQEDPPHIMALQAFATELKNPLWNQEKDLQPAIPRRATYHDLRNEIWQQVNATKAYFSKAYSMSAYNRATIVRQAPSWFPKRQKCKMTCCLETVAISLDQDEHKIINTGDGRDLADLVLEHWFPRDGVGVQHLKYHATNIHEDILPCLIPGTIIFIENHEKTLKHFWSTLRPKIHVPYILIASGSDFDTPGLSQEYLGDPLLLNYYGTNPRPPTGYPEALKHFPHKYRYMNMGFSRTFPQEKHILPYLQMTNFTNPFLDKQRWDFSRQPFDYEQDVFVHFRLNRKGRARMWKILCPTNNSSAGSCGNNTRTLPVHDLYSEMSQYRFGISPKGLGFDCYRSYEMLLLGVIPVIDERPLGGRQLFKGFPVVHMTKMENATTKQDFVDAIQKYIASDEFQEANFEEAWEKLFLQYTRRQILQDSQRDKEILVDEQGKEYYQAYQYSVRELNVKRKDTFCHVKGSCEPPAEQIKADHWMKNPAPLLEHESEWIEEFNQGY